MSLLARSPTRVDLAGGTLDCWPLYTLTGGALTTNLAIDIYTEAELTPNPGPEIELLITDLGYERKFSSSRELLASSDGPLGLISAQVRYWKPPQGFRLRTRSDSPVGAGLGGSSSLCISLIKAFSKWLGADLTTYEMVNLAHNLEAEVLRKPTGTQDYFPAIEPGLSVIHYSALGVKLEKLTESTAVFGERMLLVYTGQPHHSGLNNWQVIKAAIDGDGKTLKALGVIAEVGEAMANACRRANWQELPELFRAEFAARVQLSEGFSSPRIEELRTLALGAGAEAVKICGAGGGGCVLIWCHPAQKGEVAHACREKGYQVLAAQPVGA